MGKGCIYHAIFSVLTSGVCRDISVHIATRQQAGRGSISCKVKKYLSYPQSPDPTRGKVRPLPNGYQFLFLPGVKRMESEEHRYSA
jgi:hypothetical protein